MRTDWIKVLLLEPVWGPPFANNADNVTLSPAGKLIFEIGKIDRSAVEALCDFGLWRFIPADKLEGPTK